MTPPLLGSRTYRPVDAGTFLHVLPRGDRTRTALCGERVTGRPTPWTAEAAGACPDCAAMVGELPGREQLADAG